MDIQKTKLSKRLDLQGIRALAIIVVLGFHFFPEYFPNGYLGVDQFFVLSGFLMCMLLKRAENQSTCSLISLFYSKRFKRILPLYLLVILISIISLYYFFPDTAIETNQESAIHALLFVSNRPKSDQEDYFEMLSNGGNIFTHTWSLSVEIQFYFLVPFIFLIGSKLPDKLQYVCYLVTGLISFVFFFISPPTDAFNSVFARIWQFLIGMVVYLIGMNSQKPGDKYQTLDVEETEIELFVIQIEDKKMEMESVNERYSRMNSSFSSSDTLLLFLVLITLFPFAITPVVFRPLITIGTGVLMLVSEDNIILSKPFLTYIGDISYSLYLIHWPIYVYWKLTCEGDKFWLICALASSIFLAVITFETFEKWYLKLSSGSVGLLVFILFTSSIILIKKDELMDNMNSIGRNTSSLDGVTDEMTIKDAFKLNRRWNVYDQRNLYSSTCKYEKEGTPYGWCRHKELPKYGRHKMMIFGNSWTANHANLFVQECGYKAKSILQGVSYGCEPFYFHPYAIYCKIQDFVERIEKEKPDYAFYIARALPNGGAKEISENIESLDQDPIYLKMKSEMLKMIKNIKHKLYILNAIPTVHGNQVKNVASWVKENKDPKDTQNLLINPNNFEITRSRYEKLVECRGSRQPTSTT